MNMFNFMAITRENPKKDERGDFYNHFNPENFDLGETLKKLMDEKFDPHNYGDQIKYYKIFEAVDHEIFTNKNGTDEQKRLWKDNQDDIYAKCSEAAEHIIKGEENIDDEEE